MEYPYSFEMLSLMKNASRLQLVLAAAAVILGIFVFRAAWIILVEIPATRKRKRMFSSLIDATTLTKNGKRQLLPIETLVILGSGGHTAEMLRMIKHLDPAQYHITYIKAATDTTSRQRLENENDPNTNNQSAVPVITTVHDIPRSREVGQSYLSSIFTTLRAQLYCLWLVGRLAPDLILCNGPGTCLPVCLAALLYRVIGFGYKRPSSCLVFCESYCRVETLSLTGKLLYPLADLFVVHWPELHRKYPNTVLVSTFVVNNKNGTNGQENNKNKKQQQ
jgi:beta-1,4-N-acetylglucosaminyltransferase